jgi:ribulose-phosphate 3-epimerase
MSEQLRIVPAVLTDNSDSLKKMLTQAVIYTNYVQIDIMDGRFVDSRSITCEDITGVPAALQWEAHLMVENPGQYFSSCRQAGAGKVVFHIEATGPSPLQVVIAARNLGLEVGIALNPETPVNSVLPLVDFVDSVLFLSVHPGYYGAQFIPAVLDKVKELRSLCPSLYLGIDGGIKAANIQAIAASGVNDIFIGSAIVLQPDPAQAFHQLQTLARSSGPVST